MWLLLTAVRQVAQVQAAAQLSKALCCCSKTCTSSCSARLDQSGGCTPCRTANSQAKVTYLGTLNVATEDHQVGAVLIGRTSSMLAVSSWSVGPAGSDTCDQTELFNESASLVQELQDQPTIPNQR